MSGGHAVAPSAGSEWRHSWHGPIISYYNQKGGIGKTTTLHVHARCLAQQFGYKVLVVDCDPQRNLTYDMAGDQIKAYGNGFYKSWISRPKPDGAARTLLEILRPLSDNALTDLAAVDLLKVPIPGQGELWLLCGDEEITELDVKINQAETLHQSAHFICNYFAAPYYAVMKAAKTCNADIVMLDLSPSNGVLNKVLTLTSSHLLIPSTLDSKSLEGIVSICNRLVDTTTSGWCHWGKFMGINHTKKSTFVFPERRPKLLGWTLNSYNIRKRGEIHDCLREDELARNDSGFFEQLCNVFHCCTERLQQASEGTHTYVEGENMHTWKISTMHIDQKAYHLAKEIPEERQGDNRKLHLLGRTSDYNQQRMVSQHFYVPLPFLGEEHLVIRDTNVDSPTYNDFVAPKSKRQMDAMRDNVRRHKDDVIITVRSILR